MKGFENQTYLIAYIISNIVGLAMLFAARKWPRIGRFLFFLLFGWASWVNWTTAIETPQAYQEYADLTFSGFYQQFIHGWFKEHTLLAVGFIATAQGLIALSMLLKGWIYKMGCVGGILFLLAIMPFGVGSAFPCTLVMAIAMYVLWQHGHDYIWKMEKHGKLQWQ
jgi:hypothetical protein